MWKNYLKIAWRNLIRNKSFTIINISGLIVGMTLTMLLMLWVRFEYTYDQFHIKKDRLFEVYHHGNYNGSIGTSNNTPQPLAPALEANFPEVVHSSRTMYMEVLLQAGDNQLTEDVMVMDPVFLDMFDFPLSAGDKTRIFESPLSIVLTESFATKLFGEEDPMGKAVNLHGEIDVMVTGILKDLPPNTKFHIEAILPWSLLKLMEMESDFWGNNSVHTYVELQEDTELAFFNLKVKNLIRENSDVAADIFLHPLDQWHLYSRFENGIQDGGRISVIKMLMTVGGLVILIACINFMNLSTARSYKRSKEVGIRKVSGAGRLGLVKQFLAESTLIAAIAGVSSLLLVQLLLPTFNDFISQQVIIPWEDYAFWLLFLGFIIFCGLLAGSYPAFFLSSFKPSTVLKGIFKPSKSSFTPRQVLVVVQFTFAITLIAATIVVYQQYQHAMNRELGYEKDQLIYLPLYGGMQSNYLAFRNEALQSGAVASISRTYSPISEGYGSSAAIDWPGKMENETSLFDHYSSDANLVNTAGLELIEGRDIDMFLYPSDSSAMMINESALKVMQLQNPIGEKIQFNDKDWEIVGVVKDFVLRSPFETTSPMIIAGPNFFYNTIHIKLNPSNNMQQTIATLEAVVRKYNGDVSVDFKFVDEDYGRKFSGAARTAKLTALFCGIAIFISCIGLFGLASFMTEQRSKEISIRKILGSSVQSIVKLLSIDFIKLVLISMIFALPSAYFAMKIFLESFSYRVDLEWYYFLATGVVALLIAILTVSGQALKAAYSNPANAMRSE